MAWCTAVGAGPLQEEILFRGCLLGRFRKQGYVASGMVWSALAFAVAHGVPSLLPAYFLHGLILGWLCHRTASLWPPFVVHAGWNVTALLWAIHLAP
ncbi:MAG: CPBP family intramembrane metalloprotease [Acidobacteriaceae bacterium]|nr:CPBP family intramembrane metalloprotease [Acidobacteriaceae bacterium]